MTAAAAAARGSCQLQNQLIGKLYQEKATEILELDSLLHIDAFVEKRTPPLVHLLQILSDGSAENPTTKSFSD